MRFAFYGRTSTTRRQDRVSSQDWQRDMADELVAGHGQVIAALYTWCTRHGLQLWLPETGGPVDLANRDLRRSSPSWTSSPLSRFGRPDQPPTGKSGSLPSPA
nr:hypothetical protein [Amycolatopsis lexingtonensis]